MIIKDYTLNKQFSELQEGTCFVMYDQYYMKLLIKYNETATYRSYAVNLKTGVANVVKDNEKVRIVKGTIMIE